MAAPIGTREYDVGDVVRTTATFKVGGVPTDPTAVTFKYKKPDGTIVTKIYGTDSEVVKDSTGTYHFEISVTASGSWSYRWASTGTAAGASERKFLVRASEF